MKLHVTVAVTVEVTLAITEPNITAIVVVTSNAIAVSTHMKACDVSLVFLAIAVVSRGHIAIVMQFH